MLVAGTGAGVVDLVPVDAAGAGVVDLVPVEPCVDPALAGAAPPAAAAPVVSVEPLEPVVPEAPDWSLPAIGVTSWVLPTTVGSSTSWVSVHSIGSPPDRSRVTLMLTVHKPFTEDWSGDPGLSVDDHW